MKNLKISKEYKNYLTVLSGISHLTPREIRFLEAIYTLKIDVVDSTKKKELSEQIGVLPKTLNTMIKTMYAKKILVKKFHGVYEVHPLLKEITDLNITFI